MICKDEEERAYRKLIEQGLKCYNQEDGGEGTIGMKQKNIFFVGQNFRRLEEERMERRVGGANQRISL